MLPAAPGMAGTEQPPGVWALELPGCVHKALTGWASEKGAALAKVS